MDKQNTSNTAQAMWIGIGSLFSFLFSIVSSAILSRYLTKGDYGTYKQVMYVYNTLLSVFTLGLPLAYSYFLPRVSVGEGRMLVNKLNRAFLALGAAFTIVLFLGADVIGNILKNQDLAHNLRIFSPAPILILPTMGLQGVLATYKKSIWNAIYVVLSRILMLLFVALPVALYKADVETAMYGFLFAHVISLTLALIIQNIPFKGVKREACGITYKDIFNYSVPLMVAGLLGVGISAADQFYVSRFFGQETFADFANGNFELPIVGMVLSAAGTVLLPVFSKMISTGAEMSNVIDLWKRTAIKSAFIIYPLVVFFWFFASDTMLFLYGNKYALSSIYFRIALIVNFFSIIPFYPIILALGKTKSYANVHLAVFVAVWLLEFISVKTINSAYAITAISVMCRISKIVLMFNVVAKSIHVSMWNLLPYGKLTVILLSSAATGFISWLVVQRLPLHDYHVLSLAVGFVLFASFTFIVSKPLHINYLEVLQPVLSKLTRKK